jgi:hypothetical protein
LRWSWIVQHSVWSAAGIALAWTMAMKLLSWWNERKIERAETKLDRYCHENRTPGTMVWPPLDELSADTGISMKILKKIFDERKKEMRNNLGKRPGR